MLFRRNGKSFIRRINRLGEEIILSSEPSMVQVYLGNCNHFDHWCHPSRLATPLLLPSKVPFCLILIIAEQQNRFEDMLGIGDGIILERW